MILIALDLYNRARVVEPKHIAQGTDSESIVLLSPFPVGNQVMMGWVMPDGLAVEIPLDNTQNSPKTRYWPMRNVPLPEGYDGNVQSVWTFTPSANLTAQYGTALACFYVQKVGQGNNPINDEPIQGYKSLTFNPVEIYVTETLNPMPDGEVDPESPLLEQILAAITYYNEYLGDIEENGVSTVHDTEGNPQREVYTDDTPTAGSNNLITSNAVAQVYNAAKSYTDDKTDAVKDYANTQAAAALNAAKAYTDEQMGDIPSSPVTGVKGSEETEYRQGNVNITPANIGLGYVNNTPDSQKPVSTAQRQAIDAAEQRAKDFAATLAYQGQGTNLLDGNGDPIPVVTVTDTPEEGSDNLVTSDGVAKNGERTYKSVLEIDNTFNENVTLNEVVDKMDDNSILKCVPAYEISAELTYLLPPSTQIKTFRNLIPEGAEGIYAELLIKKTSSKLEKTSSNFIPDAKGIFCSYKERKLFYGIENLGSSTIPFDRSAVLDGKLYSPWGGAAFYIRDLNDTTASPVQKSTTDVNATLSICAYDGNVYIFGKGAQEGLVYPAYLLKYDPNEDTVTNLGRVAYLTSASDNYGYFPFIENNDKLYVGTKDGNVIEMVFDQQGNVTASEISVAQARIRALCFGDNGLYIGTTQNKGLYLYDGTTVESITLPEDAPSEYIFYYNGFLCLVGHNGIVCKMDETDKSFEYIDQPYGTYSALQVASKIYISGGPRFSTPYSGGQINVYDMADDTYTRIISPGDRTNADFGSLLYYNEKLYLRNLDAYILLNAPVDTYVCCIGPGEDVTWEKLATEAEIEDIKDIDFDDKYAQKDHTHGNISNDGKVGDTSGKILVTGTDGAVEAKSVSEIKSLFLDLIYPVGSVIYNSSLTTVAQVEAQFGGTWEKYAEGRFIVGLKSNDTDFDTVGETGGSKAAALPQHSHTYNAPPSATDGHTLTTAEMPEHKHSYGIKDRGYGGIIGFTTSQGALVNAGQSGSDLAVIQPQLGASEVENANGQLHINNEGGGGSHTHDITATSGTTGGAGTADTSNANLPPYIVCYCYRRTA